MNVIKCTKITCLNDCTKGFVNEYQQENNFQTHNNIGF